MYFFFVYQGSQNFLFVVPALELTITSFDYYYIFLSATSQLLTHSNAIKGFKANNKRGLKKKKKIPSIFITSDLSPRLQSFSLRFILSVKKKKNRTKKNSCYSVKSCCGDTAKIERFQTLFAKSGMAGVFTCH